MISREELVIEEWFISHTAMDVLPAIVVDVCPASRVIDSRSGHMEFFLPKRVSSMYAWRTVEYPSVMAVALVLPSPDPCAVLQEMLLGMSKGDKRQRINFVKPCTRSTSLQGQIKYVHPVVLTLRDPILSPFPVLPIPWSSLVQRQSSIP
jgi:hypothetical protein